jgi:hypothetical protein
MFSFSFKFFWCAFQKENAFGIEKIHFVKGKETKMRFPQFPSDTNEHILQQKTQSIGRLGKLLWNFIFKSFCDLV